jgi:hypothetical protein
MRVALRWIVGVFVCAVVALLLIKGLAMTASRLFPDTAFARAISPEQPNRLDSPERVRAQNDHAYIDSWIDVCVKASGRSAPVDNEAWKTNARWADNLIELRLINLSQALSRQREDLGEASADAYFWLQWTTAITIGLGALTTVLVVLSSTDAIDFGVYKPYLKVSAIISPALGTAAATFIAFYAPADIYSKSKSALASMTLLHRQIALQAARMDCPKPKDESWKNALAKLEAWEDQYANLLGTLSAKEPGQVEGKSGDPKQGQGSPPPQQQGSPPSQN